MSAERDAYDISVVIPTYNRPADLAECLESVAGQTVRPVEVLVVDNSDAAADDTRQVVERLRPGFAAAGIALRYVVNQRTNSLTAAKNAGIDQARGDIISFLDDDVVLDPRYYEAILAVYRDRPHALGVEGAVAMDGRVSAARFAIEQLLGRVFFLGYREASRCRVLPSLAVTYPLTDEVVSCEWLSGASTYRRDVFREFRPDERLRKYADNEDLDLSYRIFKRHPATLFFTPHARYRHKGSLHGRATGKGRIYMQEVYRLYLLSKHIAPTPLNVLIYLWSRAGTMLYLLGRAALRRSAADLAEAGHLPGAWALCVRHRREIRAGDLRFFERFL